MLPRRFRFVVAISAALIPEGAAFAQTPPAFRTLASFSGQQFAAGPRPSPDGRFLLISTSSELQVYETATGQTRKLAGGRGWELAWSPRGDRVAWVRGGDDGSGEYVWTMPIDPRTAAPTGPAQRVTVGQGEFPAISFDGQWIAYAAPETEGQGTTNGLLPHRLAVVPVTGGPERTLARFKRGIDAINWSVDGKTIYLAGALLDGPGGVLKISVEGRPPQVVRSTNEFMAGMTTDRRHIVLVPAKGNVGPGDRAVIIDTSGQEVARVPLPVGAIISYMGVIGDSALVWVDIDARRRIEIRSVAGGPAQRVALTGESSEAPVWSPDGKQIAFHVRQNRRRSLGVMSADGTNVRVLQDTELRPVPGVSWSPDSKLIGFVSLGGQRLTILDVASGAVRATFEDTTSRFGVWTWRPDGKSVAAVRIKQASPPRGTIDELSLSGERRPLFDFGTLDPQLTWSFVFVDGSRVIYRSDSSAFLISLADGSRRRLAAVPPATIVFGATVSTDREWVAGPLWDSKRPEFNRLELLATDSDDRRVLDVPFRFATNAQSVFHPDGRSVLTFGQPVNDTMHTHLFAVPLDGGTPRTIARIANVPSGATVSVSPDGESVAYSVQDSRVLHLLLVDLRPPSQRSTERSRR